MTRQGKCDICRHRKVKVHPVCGPCAKSNRSCGYRADPNLKFRGFRASPYQTEHQELRIRDDSSASSSLSETGTSLVLRSTTIANVGDGKFQKFVPSKPAVNQHISPSAQGQDHLPLLKQPSSSELTLVSRWKAFAEVTNPGEPHPYIFGEWQEILPPRFGHSKVIDLGVECFFQCATAYGNPTEHNLAKTYELNAKAVMAMRKVLFENKTGPVQDDILIATTYLKIVEAIMNAQSGNYKIHVRGGIDFLQRISQQGSRCTDVCKIVFYTSASHEFVSYILKGEDSVFDSPAWLHTTIPNIVDPLCPSPMFAQEYITKSQARLPRLVRLTREARESPEDPMARARAAALLTDIYRNDLESWVQEILATRRVWPLPTTDSKLAPFVSTSFNFKSTRIYQRLIAYWELRCLVCGLVIAFANILPIMPSISQFDVLQVATEEIQAAESIAMSMQYARQKATSFSIGMLWQLRPLMMSYGVWCRLERCGATESEVQKATSMKDWTLIGMKEITSKFKARDNNSQELEYLHGILTGNPLPGTKSSEGI